MCPLCGKSLRDEAERESLLLVTSINYLCRWSWSKDQLKCVTLHLPKVVLGPAATQKTRQALDVEFPPWEEACFCGVVVCSHGLAAFLRSALSLCLFIGSYEESYVMTHYTHGLWLLLSLLLTSFCYFCRQQAGLSRFGVWCHLRMPVNKEWNERD